MVTNEKAPKPVPIILFRQTPTPRETFVNLYEKHTPLEPFKSILPPPGNLQLSVTMGGAHIGRGATADVFPCTVEPYEGGLLPPLVIKTSCWADSLDREAWAYGEMESLQGISIPRCYGLYTAPLPFGCRLPFRKERSKAMLDCRSTHSEQQRSE